MQLKLFVLLVLQPVLVFSQLCPNGWSLHDDSCFRLYSDLKTFHEAQLFCKQQAGDLAMAKTDAVNSFLANLIVQGASSTAMLGLHDLATEDTYYWVDGTALTQDQEQWAPGQPNDAGGVEDCVELHTNGTWNDWKCVEDKPYICERDNDVPLACDETNKWYSAANKCFKFFSGKKNWQTAEQFCLDVGGNLISINSEEEQTMARNQVQVGGNAIWTGLSDVNGGAAGNYKWSTGASLSYANWAPNQPDSRYYTTGGDCVEILTTASNGEWSTSVCTSTRAYMCERPEGTCPTGWRMYRGNCYQFNAHHLQPWYTAKFVCEAQGTHLLTDFDNAENSYIVDQMKDLTDVGVDTTWLGLSDIVNDQRFAWVESSSVGYTNWNTNEPSSISGSKDCAFIFTGDGVGKWRSGSCSDDNKKAYVCKVRADQPIMPLDPGVAIGMCDDGWSLNGASCYYFDWTSRLYNDAERNCSTMGAHLTSILSQEEQSFLSMRTRMGGVKLWIGLHDINTEGDFGWTDGSPFGFVNWAPGQPDNWQSEEDVVHMRSTENHEGLWNDADGLTKKFASVCKKKSQNSIIVNPSIQPTPAFDPRCGNGWEFDTGTQNCYLFRDADYRSWFDAREYCRVQGGDLTSIVSKAEQQYMNGRLIFTKESTIWIGGNDISKEGGWEWSDGSAFAYVNWNDNEPNNVGNAEHCMEIFANRDSWNDNRCPRTHGFICKKNGYIITHFNVQPHKYMTGTGKLTVANTYPDACAEQCVTMTTFTCKSFNYNRATHECTFNDATSTTPMSDINLDYYQRLMDVVNPTTTSMPPGYRCRDNWSGYGDNCYFIYTTSKLDYDQAQTKCTSEGGDLASIHDLNENSFIRSLARDSGVTTEMWIGLNDINDPGTFQWEDSTPVDYTQWNVNEPNSHKGTAENCVEMFDNGYWNDKVCTWTRPAACKRPKEDLGPTQFPITPSGCNLGEVANGGSCYFAMDSAKSWVDAQTDCQTFGPNGKLVSIADRYEQTVLSSLLGMQDGTLFWIGLNDRTVKGKYAWGDNTAVAYTNWDYMHPDDSKGRCVASTSGNAAGLWRNIDCSSTQKYVCERLRSGYTTPPTVAPPTPATPPSDVNCSPNWKGYGGNCFLIVTSDVSGSSLRIWSSAQTYCESLGANLASFHSNAEESYIVSLGNSTVAAAYWIGFHDMSIEGGFEWTDKTPVDYTNWDNGEPNNGGFLGQDCTQFFFTGTKWNDADCYNLNNYICEIPKGVIPFYTTQAPSTVTPWPACDTDSDWIKYTVNNYCYFFSAGLSGSGSSRDWMDANSYCMQSGGYLASIHDQRESDFIYNYVQRYVVDAHWIGLREYTVEGVYTWSDGLAFDYQNWGNNEPNDANGEEQCAELYAPAGMSTAGIWNDANCGQKSAFICRKPNGAVVPITHPPTHPPVGNCRTGYHRFDNQCYRIYGMVDPSERKAWYDARANCRSTQWTDLVTIHSRELNSFLASKMMGAETSMYIGLNDNLNSGRFVWTDGSGVDYTNWNSGEPNNAGSGEDCVEMIALAGNTGKWNDMDCGSIRGYICQGDLDPSAPLQTNQPNTCRDGFTPFGTSCFQVVQRAYTFSESQLFCRTLGNDVYLASIASPYEEAFAETLSHTNGGELLWIGLYDDETSGQYLWSDGWPVWFTAWGPSEPSAGPDEGCVALLPTGGWNDTFCPELYKPLCKYSTVITPTDHPDVPGYCPDESWSPYGRNCYRVTNNRTDTRMSWPEAQFRCSQYNATLASLHSRQQVEFVRGLVEENGYTDVWIGLTRGDLGGFVWVDESPVDFTNWNPGEPSFASQRGIEDCVEAYLSTGKWNDVDCLWTQGYVCQQPKLGMSSSQAPPPKSPSVALSVGVIVSIVLGIAIVVIVIGIIAFCCNNTRSKSLTINDTLPPEIPGTISFDNALYKSGDDNVEVSKGGSKA